MKKIIYLLFVIAFSILLVSCKVKKEVKISSEVVFDCAGNNDLVIYTENIQMINNITYDDQDLLETSYKFLNNKIYVDDSLLRGFGYGEYEFTVIADEKEYPVTVYVSDSRTSKITVQSEYKYDNADILIPIELYDCTFELFYKDKKIDDFSIVDGNLVISAQFIEKCDVENIVIQYKITYRSFANPKNMLTKEGDINIKKILFGDIEW